METATAPSVKNIPISPNTKLNRFFTGNQPPCVAACLRARPTAQRSAIRRIKSTTAEVTADARSIGDFRDSRVGSIMDILKSCSCRFGIGFDHQRYLSRGSDHVASRRVAPRSKSVSIPRWARSARRRKQTRGREEGSHPRRSTPTPKPPSA